MQVRVLPGAPSLNRHLGQIPTSLIRPETVCAHSFETDHAARSRLCPGSGARSRPTGGAHLSARRPEDQQRLLVRPCACLTRLGLSLHQRRRRLHHLGIALFRLRRPRRHGGRADATATTELAGSNPSRRSRDMVLGFAGRQASSGTSGTAPASVPDNPAEMPHGALSDLGREAAADTM